MRRLNETLEQYAIRHAYETGHFWSRENREGWNIRADDLPNLTVSDPVVIRAFRSMTLADPFRYTKLVLRAHGRRPNFDGEYGPAVQTMVLNSQNRCPIPDNPPPPGVVFAFDDPDLQQIVLRMQDDAAKPQQIGGRGNWRGCHGRAGHTAIFRWDRSHLPAHLRPVFLKVLRLVQRAYAETGLLLRFTDEDGADLLNGDDLSGETVNSQCSFVPAASGWIGLAIVGKNQRCSDTIWAKFLKTYRGGTSEQQVTNQWFTLIAHEILHNCGSGHTAGGIGNPSLITGLPMTWRGDPSWRYLTQQFGGTAVPIPGDGGGDGPDEPPVPPSDVASQIRKMQIEMAVMDATVDWLVGQVKELRNTRDE
jgi:hypothetical protein